MKKKKTKKRPIRCPVCGHVAVLRDASFVYGKRSRGGHLYVCSQYPKCDSYVTADETTLQPRGSLATGDLRHKRIETHRLFDQIWKRKIMSRPNAYKWIQDKFGLRAEHAHIGYFSSYMCDALMEECKKTLDNHRSAN